MGQGGEVCEYQAGVMSGANIRVISVGDPDSSTDTLAMPAANALELTQEAFFGPAVLILRDHALKQMVEFRNVFDLRDVSLSSLLSPRLPCLASSSSMIFPICAAAMGRLPP